MLPTPATTADALFHAALGSPDDDAYKQVYADFLDERGSPGDRELADLLRELVEVRAQANAVRAACGCDSCVAVRGGSPPRAGGAPCALGSDPRGLRVREMNLLDAYRRATQPDGR